MKPEFATLEFGNAGDWREWLLVNAAESDGVWLRLYKKTSGTATVNHDEALDQALCFGWIDGQIKPLDDKSWLRKFTPRRPKSLWSKKNIERVERLIKDGLMQPAGLKEVEAAKADGRWSSAYDAPSEATIPEDFLAALKQNPAANKTFETLNKANLYAITWRLQTAKKPETRSKRLAAMIEMLASGKKFH